VGQFALSIYFDATVYLYTFTTDVTGEDAQFPEYRLTAPSIISCV